MFELDDLERQRLDKAERLRAMGIDPYPARCTRTHTAAQAVEQFDQLQDQSLTVIGRIMAIRVMGKSAFAHIADASGRVQLYFKLDILGEESYELFKRMYDIGDFISATGTLFRTRTGEVTLQVHSFAMQSKSLHPLPEKWHGLTDVEKRYRQRYVDLIVNEDVRRVFVARSKIITSMRRFLDERGFLEVETPILQPQYGGAMARPFVTRHNALDRSLFLRIAVELYLKRLIVGGYERVYEIGKDFRNEGIDTRHNPEFTMMELYQACADYNDIMTLTEEMVAYIAKEVLGTTTGTWAGETIDFAPPWPRRPMRQVILEYSGVDYEEYPTQEALYKKIRAMGLQVTSKTGRGKLIDELLKTYVVQNLVQPTFLIDYPIELSPLAKKKPGDPGTVERFQAFAGRLEIGNAFTELNDPMDQYERFADQKKEAEAGDEEAHPIDEDYVMALMYGMPPTGGLGVGIDRLTMILTDNQSIRDVILFPQLRA